MFIGHLAVAFAAKKASPKASLGTYFIAAQFVDMLWPLLLLLGIEHARIDPGNTAFAPIDFYDYPFTHSLVMSLVWSLLVGGIYYALRKDSKTSLILGGAVFSHWVLDVISHRPDMPLWFGDSAKIGLGLWSSVPATIVVEAAMFVTGVWLYVSTTTPKNRTGTFALWGLVGFLVVMYVANAFSPPPPSIQAVAYAGMASWLLTLWPYWVDRNRSGIQVPVTQS